MKAKVTDECIACQLCVEACPEVFEMDDIAVVKVNEVPPELEAKCTQAAEECPVDAIILE